MRRSPKLEIAQKRAPVGSKEIAYASVQKGMRGISEPFAIIHYSAVARVTRPFAPPVYDISAVIGRVFQYIQG